MFSTPVSLQAVAQAREREREGGREKTVGKYVVVGKVGWEEGGGDGASESEAKHRLGIG